MAGLNTGDEGRTFHGEGNKDKRDEMEGFSGSPTQDSITNMVTAAASSVLRDKLGRDITQNDVEKLNFMTMKSATSLSVNVFYGVQLMCVCTMTDDGKGIEVRVID